MKVPVRADPGAFRAFGRARKDMGDFQQYFDIILFAMIAGFLVLRLRSVLGRRTGNERRRELFARRPAPVAEKVVSLVEPEQRSPRLVDDGLPADVVAEGVKQIRRTDPSFDPAHFIEGARSAFEIIVGGFAKGDKAALRPLLSDEVFRGFAAAIDERIAARETLETHIERLDSVDIVQADLEGRTAQITLRLVSHQINVTRAMDGSIVEGDPENPVEKTDFWTFARDTRSTDPNWVLIATGSG
jgi:predicted lipid-binding transport protein (Tim44 family)